MADYKDGISRSISRIPPSHYIVKIQSFSLLAKNNITTFTSKEFEAGGYKWKLILHPNGNKEKNVDDYISLYLMMVVNKGSLLPIHATFRFFIFDQNNDDYFVIQDIVRPFDELKHEWGIHRLISLEAFENPSNGYLIKDTCAFGAEVYVCQKKVTTAKVDSLSMVTNPISYTHTWKICKFSKLNAKRVHSETFIVWDQKWKVLMDPKGNGAGTGTHVSLFLALDDRIRLPPGYQIHAEFTLRVMDQGGSADQSAKAKQWFSSSSSSWGWSTFISINDVKSPNRGYLKNDICIIEAEVKVHGVS